MAYRSALGHKRKVLANLDSGHVGLDGPEGTANRVGSVGLEVPGIELTGPADQEQEDTVDVAAGLAGGARQVGQRQADSAGAGRSHPEKIAPVQPVAKAHALLAVKVQHARIPSRLGPPVLLVHGTVRRLGCNGKTPASATIDRLHLDRQRSWDRQLACPLHPPDRQGCLSYDCRIPYPFGSINRLGCCVIRGPERRRRRAQCSDP